MHNEIDSIEDFERQAQIGGFGCTVIQGLDLRAYTDALTAGPCTEAVFLGCLLEDAATRHIQATGGLIFPRLRNLPFRTYRPNLYTVDELMAGYQRGNPESYANSLDQRVYAHFDQQRQAHSLPVLEALAQRLHDHAIDNALADLLHGAESSRHVIAIMGGHAMLRTDPEYRKVARIAQRLAAHDPRILVASGGGPGAMEACTLGGWLTKADESVLDQALEILSQAPSYRDEAWLDTAFEVRDAFPDHGDSLGIPTWFYGHEPPNLFASHIAKYFSNSLREDGLLAIAQYGVIYAPGSAGTIQEIFQDAAQNHYGTFKVVSPMVFLGRRYWTEKKPIFPILRDLAADRQYGALLTLADEVDEVVDFILEHPPLAYEG